MSNFSLPWWIVILLSKFGSASTFCSLHFQYCEISLRVLLMQSFLLASLLLVHLHPFLTFCIYVDKFILFSLFTFMLISSPSWSSSGCVSRISLHLESLEWQQSTLSLSAISLITLFMFDWNFTSKIITFCSLVHFHHCWLFPSFAYSFL